MWSLRRKNLVLLPTTFKQSTKTSTYQGTSKISEENIIYEQNLGYPTTTINNNNYSIQYSAQKQQIESIIYQKRAKIYSTRYNEYEIKYDKARIRLHLLNVVKVVMEDRKSARIANNLLEELKNVIIRELQEPRSQCLFVFKTQ